MIKSFFHVKKQIILIFHDFKALEENPSRPHETPPDEFHEQPVDVGLSVVRRPEENGQANCASRSSESCSEVVLDGCIGT